MRFTGARWPMAVLGSVTVHDLDVEGIARVPGETQPKLVVHPDAVLPLAVFSKRFQTIRRWRAQRIECDRAVQQLQLASDNVCDVGEARNALAFEQGLRVAADADCRDNRSV